MIVDRILGRGKHERRGPRSDRPRLRRHPAGRLQAGLRRLLWADFHDARRSERIVERLGHTPAGWRCAVLPTQHTESAAQSSTQIGIVHQT